MDDEYPAAAPALPEPPITPRGMGYRIGRHNKRNVYRVNVGSHDRHDDWHIGCMFTPEDGVTVVAALNLAHDLGLLTQVEKQ